MDTEYIPMEGVGGWFLGWNLAPTDNESIRRDKNGCALYFASRDAALEAEELFQNPFPNTKPKRLTK